MSQCERLQKWLESEGEIDPLTSWTKLGIYRLGARIFDLRQKGLNIKTGKKEVVNQFGEVCKVASYELMEAANEV